MKVFVVFHQHETEWAEETKLVGIYSTEEHAVAAVERLRSRPGFADFPDGFSVDVYELDRDHWGEGFVPWRPGEE